MVFRILAGLPRALYGACAGSGDSRLLERFWAIFRLDAGLGLAGGARKGRWYDVRG